MEALDPGEQLHEPKTGDPQSELPSWVSQGETGQDRHRQTWTHGGGRVRGTERGSSEVGQESGLQFSR